MKRFFASLTIFSLCVFGLLDVEFARADAVITGTDNLSATVGVALPITDVQISGGVGTIPVKLLVTNGSLAFGSTTGLTFDGDNSGSEIYFSGTQSAINAALATLTYTRMSAGTDELEVSLVEPGEVFFSENGHLYEYISSVTTWQAANTAASSLTRYGASGYLATITSETENDFVSDRLLGAGWMGASDAGSEGDWKWVTGPETGTSFWSGTAGGSAVSGRYENWNTGEPNESGSGEDCGQFLSGASGEWNDLPCTVTTLAGYVVEFGAPGDLPDTAGAEFTIDTYAAPVVETLSPADNATQVSRTTDLVLTFDVDVVVGTGDIRIVYVNSGGTLVTIPVTGDAISGSGTDTITVNIPGSLPRSTEFAVQIDATAFDGEAGGSYAGISGTTAWSFTTIGGGSSLPESITNTSLTVSAGACVGSSREVALTARATGGEHYILSKDPNFISDSWKSMGGTVVTETWSATPEDSGTMIYGLVKNTGGTLARLSAVIPTITPCSEVVSDDEEVLEGGEDLSGFELIRGVSNSAVYRFENGVRKPFYNSAIFLTWFSNFDLVKTVSDLALAEIPLGPQVLPRAGSLIKIPSVIDVYVVEDSANGYRLRLIEDEASAAREFGADWASRVLDVDVTLFKKFAR